jgi:hypothetical protein
VIGEYSVVTARRGPITAMAERGRAGAKAALRLMDVPVRVISTVQVGINALGILTGAVGEPIVRHLLGDGLPHWLGFGIVTYLSVVLGELVPTALTLDRAERLAVLVAPPVELMSKVLRPVVWVLQGSAQALLRPFGVRDVVAGETIRRQRSPRTVGSWPSPPRLTVSPQTTLTGSPTYSSSKRHHDDHAGDPRPGRRAGLRLIPGWLCRRASDFCRRRVRGVRPRLAAARSRRHEPQGRRVRSRPLPLIQSRGDDARATLGSRLFVGDGLELASSVRTEPHQPTPSRRTIGRDRLAAGGENGLARRYCRAQCLTPA